MEERTCASYKGEYDSENLKSKRIAVADFQGIVLATVDRGRSFFITWINDEEDKPDVSSRTECKSTCDNATDETLLFRVEEVACVEWHHVYQTSENTEDDSVEENEEEEVAHYESTDEHR